MYSKTRKNQKAINASLPHTLCIVSANGRGPNSALETLFSPASVRVVNQRLLAKFSFHFVLCHQVDIGKPKYQKPCCDQLLDIGMHFLQLSLHRWQFYGRDVLDVFEAFIGLGLYLGGLGSNGILNGIRNPLLSFFL